MAKLVVSTWNRDRADNAQKGYGMKARLSTLEAAVAKTQQQIDASAFKAKGLIRGIFVAPEYLFALKFAGGTMGATKYPRALWVSKHDNILKSLAAISRRFPRILFIPGTITWKTMLDLDDVEKRLKYYEGREANKKIEGAELKMILKREWRWDLNNGTLCCKDDRVNYQNTYGAPMPTAPLSDADIQRIEQQNPQYFQIMLDWTVRNPEMYLSTKTARQRLADPNVNQMMFNTAYVFLNGQIVHKYNKQGNFDEEFGDASVVFVPGARRGVQTIEGIRFGFEICLDHAAGYLVRQSRGGGQVDVQIIMSDFVRNDDLAQTLIIRPGGYLIHASTAIDYEGVGMVQPNHQITPAAQLGADTVDGSDLFHWLIDLKVHDPFDLRNTFMQAV